MTDAPASRRIVAVALSLLALILLLSGGLAYHSTADNRDAALHHARVTSRNIATLLRDNLGSTLDGVDRLLRTTENELQEKPWNQPDSRSHLDEFLSQQKEINGQISSLFVTGAEGIVIKGGGAQDGQVSVADRDYFIAARDDPHAGLVIGKPIVGRIDREWLLPIARRLNKENGAFNGVVVASLSLDSLSNMFSSADVGPTGSVVLFDGQRNMIVRHAASTASGNAVGLKMSSQQIIALMDAGTPESSYEAVSTTDAIHRIYFYRKVGDYPLFVLAGLGEPDYLREWQLQRTTALVLYAAFAIVVLTIGLALMRLWRKHHRSLWQLREAQIAVTTALAANQSSEQEQRRLVEKLSLVLETVADGIIGLDHSHHVMFANRAAAAMLDFPSPEAMLGRSSRDSLQHHLSDGTPSDQLSIDGGEVRRVEHESFISQTGRAIPVEYTAAPISGADGQGLVLVFRDVASRRAMEAEVKRSNAELEQFAYTASHDLRQPLRMINSYLALIKRQLGERAEGDLAEFIGFATDGAKRMDRLILDLLEYSRIGRSNESLEILQLSELASEALLNLKLAVEEAGALVLIPDDLPRIMGHRSQLIRLLQNLFGNAVKYRSPERPCRVSLDWHDGGFGWQFRLYDNGIGIPAEHRETAFQVFQRLASGDQYEGTGIGLAVCKKIVETHGGQIWIEDNPDGPGCCFCFTLPKG